MALAVAMDAAHPLFKAVWVPGDVVVEEHMAALKVDALPGRFRGDQDLELPIFELLFRVEPRARFVAGA